MTSESAVFTSIQKNLALPGEWRPASRIEQAEMTAYLRQERPYLALRKASRWESGTQGGLLAEVEFEPGVCDGHYPGSATIPLVDMGRAMDQAAALFGNHHSEIPLLKRISKLRAESMDVARPEGNFWIWAALEKGEIVTRLYEAGSVRLLASINGWEYDHSTEVSATRAPRFGSLADSLNSETITWNEQITRGAIAALVPQAPPFFVLQAARRGRTACGGEAVETLGCFGIKQVSGHLAGRTLLGPMHYSRTMAQSGMLLAALVGAEDSAVPEVVSAKTIWHDTREYFEADAEVVTTVICDRVFSRAGLTFVTLHGDVSVGGKTVLGTDCFTYALVPACRHPARMAASAVQ